MIWDLGLSACGFGVSIRCSLFFVQYLSRKSKRHTTRRAWANIQGGERHRVCVSRANGVRREGRTYSAHSKNYCSEEDNLIECDERPSQGRRAGVGVRCSVFLCLKDKKMGVGCWVLRVACFVFSVEVSSQNVTNPVVHGHKHKGVGVLCLVLGVWC